jgi:hypothetical protein
MLLGNSILIVGTAFQAPASIQFRLILAELEGPQPLWSITTAVSGCFIALIVFLNDAAAACVPVRCDGERAEDDGGRGPSNRLHVQ